MKTFSITFLHFFYNITVIGLDFVMHFFALFSTKIREFVRIRKENINLPIMNSQVSHLDIWVLHGASVGELIQVEAMIPYILYENNQNSNKNKILILLSYFSPSGEKKVQQIAKQYPNQVFYQALPWDNPFRIKKWYQQIQPKVFIAGSYDIWPNVVLTLKKNNVPIFLISAILSSQSKRFDSQFKKLNKYIYQQLTFIDTVDRASAERFQSILWSASTTDKDMFIFTDGDTRCDFIAKTISLQPDQAKKQKLNLIAQWINNKKVFIAASTYEPCDRIISPVLQRLTSEKTNLAILYVPHHTHLKRINQIKRIFKQHKINFILASQWAEKSYNKMDINRNKHTQVLILDEMGLLIYLYKLADVALIGGSFYKKIHNTYEPAIFGLPLAFGPYYKNSPEAVRFVGLGGASVIENSQSLYTWLMKMLQDETNRKKIGKINANEFERNTGAAKKTTQRIFQHLKSNK